MRLQGRGRGVLHNSGEEKENIARGGGKVQRA